MTSSQPLLLVVEDEAPLRRLLRASLGNAGYRLIEAESGEQALRLAAQQPPDLVILDLGLPDLDGQEVLKRLREWLAAPIIVLSARDRETEKVTALDLGADDYVTKPFGAGELLARIRAALRHRQGAGEAAPTFEHAGLKIDFAARRVFAEGVEVHLTPLEYKLMA